MITVSIPSFSGLKTPCPGVPWPAEFKVWHISWAIFVNNNSPSLSGWGCKPLQGIQRPNSVTTFDAAAASCFAALPFVVRPCTIVQRQPLMICRQFCANGLKIQAVYIPRAAVRSASGWRALRKLSLDETWHFKHCQRPKSPARLWRPNPGGVPIRTVGDTGSDSGRPVSRRPPTVPPARPSPSRVSTPSTAAHLPGNGRRLLATRRAASAAARRRESGAPRTRPCPPAGDFSSSPTCCRSAGSRKSPTGSRSTECRYRLLVESDFCSNRRHHRYQWRKQDQMLKTKTKTTRQRPLLTRPRPLEVNEDIWRI